MSPAKYICWITALAIAGCSANYAYHHPTKGLDDLEFDKKDCNNYLPPEVTDPQTALLFESPQIQTQGQALSKQEGKDIEAKRKARYEDLMRDCLKIYHYWEWRRIEK